MKSVKDRLFQRQTFGGTNAQSTRSSKGGLGADLVTSIADEQVGDPPREVRLVLHCILDNLYSAINIAQPKTRALYRGYDFLSSRMKVVVS